MPFDKRGITPACAGKRAEVIDSSDDSWDHPRVCGEKTDHAPRPLPPAGSPPRVRGKAGIPDSPQRIPGITPACAGKSAGAASGSVRHEDHPRVCGEKKATPLMYGSTMGSPPRVRGKAPDWSFLCWCDRITPACAGKRNFVIVLVAFKWDHPRVCGEKLTQRPMQARTLGSPPRVRGKGTISAGRRAPCRITPACAGKRRYAGLTAKFLRDHPRVCGEKALPGASAVTTPGSPPRVRGKDSHQVRTVGKR